MKKKTLIGLFIITIFFNGCSRWQLVNFSKELSSKKLSKTENVYFDINNLKLTSSGMIFQSQLFSDYEISEALKSGLEKHGKDYQLNPYFLKATDNQGFLAKIDHLSMTSSAKENGTHAITVNTFVELYQMNDNKKIRSKFFLLSKRTNINLNINDQAELKNLTLTLIEGIAERIDIWINKRIYIFQKK